MKSFSISKLTFIFSIHLPRLPLTLCISLAIHIEHIILIWFCSFVYHILYFCFFVFLCPVTRKGSIVILDYKVVVDIVLVSYYITFKKTTKTEHGHTITRKSFSSFKNELFSIIFIIKKMWHSHLSFLFYILTNRHVSTDFITDETLFLPDVS